MSSSIMKKRNLATALALAVAAVVALFFLLRSSEVPLPESLKLTLPKTGVPGSLKVPVVHYERRTPSGGTERVDFVGAVHFGEKSYYGELNARFKGYDAVLFELVGDPREFKRRRQSGEQSSIGFVQLEMARMLGMTFQLEGINYNAPNFVHADLSPAQLSDAMSARGESVASMLLKLVLVSLDPKITEEMERSGFEEPELEGINPLLIVLRGPTPDERQKIKVFLAKGLVSSDIFIKALQGDTGTSLIDDRNAAALKATAEQLKAGHKNLAVFYGVGHLPDLHKRLSGELGFRIVGVEWVEAWRL